MLKYELIKIYPGSRETGSIIETDHAGYAREGYTRFDPRFYSEFFKRIDPILVTEDGEEVYDPGFYVFLVPKDAVDDNQIISVRVKDLCSHYSGFSIFRYFIEAKKYIENTRRKFSIKEIKSSMKKANISTYTKRNILKELNNINK